MEKREQIFRVVWKVRSLDGGKVEGNCLSIDGGKFKQVKKALAEKGYLHGSVMGEEKRYEHYSTRGLSLFINEAEKTIRAEAYSQAALAQVLDDFQLPAYRQD